MFPIPLPKNQTPICKALPLVESIISLCTDRNQGQIDTVVHEVSHKTISIKVTSNAMYLIYN